MKSDRIRVVSNMSIPEQWNVDGLEGVNIRAESFQQYTAAEGDILIVNCDPHLTFKLCLHYALRPWKRPMLVAVDLVLRRPSGILGHLKTAVMRLLLGRVNLFLNYFRDLGEYGRLFGITPTRSDYIPFKPNLSRYLNGRAPVPKTGDYVLCFGKSMRDYDTFIQAMALVGLPGAVIGPDFDVVRANESKITIPLDQWPQNVRSLPTDYSDEALSKTISGARLVALPILKDTICASGIGTYLNSMLHGKCVILSKGPGGPDVLTDQAFFVEPEDVSDLARAIKLLWENAELRSAYASRGQAYARSLGGVKELCERALIASIRAAYGPHESRRTD